MTTEPETIDVEKATTTEAIETLERANIDVAISTAKRYPRNIKKAKADAVAMATMDEETAASCFYSMPRDGKTISGPSIRAAEIVLSSWGNIRGGARVIGNDGKVVKSQAFCHDLEKNVMVTVEKDRRITNKQGRTYSDDMIVVTGNAAAAVALRDAVFKAIPKALVNAVYEECRNLVAGSSKPMSERRALAMQKMAAVGVMEPAVLKLFGVEAVDQLNGDHLADLYGVYNAIKEGELTAEQVFSPETAEEPPENVKEYMSGLKDKFGGKPAKKAEAKGADPADDLNFGDGKSDSKNNAQKL